MCTLAVHWGWLDTVPGFPDRLRENPPRQGFFEHPEYLAVRAHLPAPWQDILDLAYYSGWRKNEILGLTWDELDEAGGVIRLSPARSKTLVGRILPISQPIAEALARRRARRDPDSPLVFHRDGIPIRRWRTAWRTACQAAGVPTRFLHDCRRTAARNLIRASVPERVAMLLTGHKTRAIFDRYNIINEQELLDARSRRLGRTRHPAPESRLHRHGGRQGPEPVALACDGGRRRAARRSPSTVRHELLTDDAVVVRIAHVGIGGVIAAHRGDPRTARFSAGNSPVRPMATASLGHGGRVLGRRHQNAYRRDRCSPWLCNGAWVGARSSTTGSRLPSSHSTRPGPAPVSMTPAFVYRQARSSVARSPHDIPRPAVSLQVNPVRRVPGTRVRVFGNVMRVSPLTTRAAPRPPPTKGLNGPSGRTPKPRKIHIHGQDPRQRGQIHGHGLLTVGGQEVGVTIERKSRPVGQKGLQPHGGRHGVARAQTQRLRPGQRPPPTGAARHHRPRRSRTARPGPGSHSPRR